MTEDKCFWLNSVKPCGSFYGYYPCKRVADCWKLGVVIFEVDSKPVTPKQSPFLGGGAMFFPTGNWLVVTEDSELFSNVPNSEEVLRERRMYLSTDLYAEVLKVATYLEEAD